MEIEITAEQAEELAQGEGIDDLEGFSYDLVEEIKTYNKEKYFTWENVYLRSDGKYFIQYNSKSGSYYSDYEFYFGTQLVEVVKVEVKKTEWRVVKDV